jgi:PhzF family phenazine biosynthesis protein
MPLEIAQIDAFTDRPFAGNPAAVCLLPSPRDPSWMQAVAREMNLAETAFLVQEGSDFRLRWFTPVTEVDLCGHATLASAHWLWESGALPQDAVARFHTRSGLLTATRDREWIVLDFPATPPKPAEAPPELAAALGTPIVAVTRSPFDYIVELESEAAVRALVPDYAALERIGGRGVVVTARASTPGFHFVSRFFAPAVGVPEDPVTGSAHCALVPYWSARLHGRRQFLAYQASDRGGVLRVELTDDDTRVKLSGQAVTVFRAELLA